MFIQPETASKKNDGSDQNRSSTVALFLILIVTFAAYFQLSSHSFVLLDDNVYVSDNQHVQSGLTPETIHWAFTSVDAEFWHPVTWLSYMMDTELFGVSPGSYLFTNLFIHLVNALLVFYLFKLMTGKGWESFFVSALFALHPLHVEAVAWVAERKELLCGFFWLAATIGYIFYARSPGWKRYCLVVVLFVGGIMSKSMIVTLPFTFLLLDYWPLERASLFDLATGRQWRSLVVEKIPLFGIAATGIAITLFAQARGKGLVSLEQYSLGQRLANSVTAYAAYIQKTLLPENLSVFYPVKEVSPVVLTVSALVLIAVSLFCLYFYKREKYLLTGWLWFTGTLIPVIGIVKIGNFSMADRYTYLPLIGLFVMGTFGVAALLSKSSHKKVLGGLLSVLLFAYYVPVTFQQVKTWSNSETLFNHSLAAVDDNYLAHHALGELYAGRRDFKKAGFHFAKAAEMRPDQPLFWLKLGRVFYAVSGSSAPRPGGILLRAVYAFNMAHQMAPKHPVPHFYLLCAYLDQGKPNKAREQFGLLVEKSCRSGHAERFSRLITRDGNTPPAPSATDFTGVLKQCGIINATVSFRTLIVKGHHYWERNHLKSEVK